MDVWWYVGHAYIDMYDREVELHSVSAAIGKFVDCIEWEMKIRLN